MSSDEVVGKLLQNYQETNVEWKITDFIPMMSKKPETFYSRYSSPSFVFGDALFNLRIYPNEWKDKSGEVGLYFYFAERYDDEIFCTMSLKSRSRNEEYRRQYHGVFENTLGKGWGDFCQMSELMRKKSDLLPGGVLTVLCSVRRIESRVVAIPRFERLMRVCRDLKKLLTENKFTDLVFKFKEREVRAHKMILENRSEYFQKMLSHDMVESRTGTITIDDCEPEVFQQVLSCIYSGEVDELSVGNMCQLYIAADRYQLDDLKKLCAAFMEENISADLFCDVLVVADAYNDAGLMQISKEFFIQNSKIVLAKEQWKSFRKVNIDIACELLQTIVEENADKLRTNTQNIEQDMS